MSFTVGYGKDTLERNAQRVPFTSLTSPNRHSVSRASTSQDITVFCSLPYHYDREKVHMESKT